MNAKIMKRGLALNCFLNNFQTLQSYERNSWMGDQENGRKNEQKNGKKESTKEHGERAKRTSKTNEHGVIGIRKVSNFLN